MKKTVVTTLVAALLLTTPMPVNAEVQNKDEVKVSNVTIGTHSESELMQLKANAQTQVPTVAKRYDFLNPELVSPNYSFYGLFPGDFALSNDFYHTTNTSGEEVIVKLVQYHSNGAGTASAIYTLEEVYGTRQTSGIKVTGNYTTSNTTITFRGVPASIWRLRISNVGEYKLEGNGFVYYY